MLYTCMTLDKSKLEPNPNLVYQTNMNKEKPFFNRVEREETLSQKVHSQIQNAIMQKVFLPGDRLPGEIELGEMFGVSRTAIREALRMLAARGLIEIRKGSGAFVNDFSVANVIDPFNQFLELKCGQASHLYLVQMRCMIEPEIARMAATRCSQDDLSFLTENLEQMKAHFDHPQEMIKIDIKFHRKLANTLENPLVPVIMEPIFQLMPKFISSTYRQERAPDLAIDYHTQILKALNERNGNAAYQAMKTHLELAEQHVLQYFKSIQFTDYNNLNDK